MMHIVAIINAVPGKRQDILDVLLPMLPSINTEDGCIEYTVVTDAPAVGDMHTQTAFGPDTYVCIEKWESLEHLKAHSLLPSIGEFFEKVSPFMATRTVHFLSPAAY